MPAFKPLDPSNDSTLGNSFRETPDAPIFRQNTPAFLHELPHNAIADVNGDSRHVRVQVLANARALGRQKQITLVVQPTDLVSDAAIDPRVKERTWVWLSETAPGGWGLWAHAHTNEELVLAARSEIALVAARRRALAAGIGNQVRR